TLAAHLLGEPARQQPAQLLALLLALDDRGVEHAEAAQRAGGAGARAARELEEEGLDLVGDGGRGGLAAGGDGLDRASLRDLAQELLVAGAETGGLDRPDERLDDLGIEHRAAARHRPDRVGEL